MDYVKLASMGGQARAKALTPERRREIATSAAAARWGSREPKAPSPRTIPVTLPAQLFAFVEARATAKNISLSAYVCRCVAEAMKEVVASPGAADSLPVGRSGTRLKGA
jgi:hypothetical protein